MTPIRIGKNLWMAVATLILLLAPVAGNEARLYLPLVIGSGQGEANPTPTPAPANRIVNPEFDQGSSGWAVTAYGGASANWTIDATGKLSGPNSARVTIDSPGSAAYQVQLRQAQPLQFRRLYQVSFMALASGNRQIEVVFQQENAPWAGYWSQAVDLTPVKASYGPFTFCSPVTDADTNIEFYLGAAGGEVLLDQVSLVEVPETRPPAGDELEFWDDFNYTSGYDPRWPATGGRCAAGPAGRARARPPGRRTM